MIVEQFKEVKRKGHSLRQKKKKEPFFLFSKVKYARTDKNVFEVALKGEFFNLHSI